MSKAEIQYFLTFAAGIAAFWLGGQAVAHVGLPHNHLAAEAMSRSVILGIYGLGLAILLFFTLGRQRTIKAIVIPVIIAMALAFVVALLLVKLSAGQINTQLQLGLFTLVYYIVYGMLYVLGSVIAHRLARA